MGVEVTKCTLYQESQKSKNKFNSYSISGIDVPRLNLFMSGYSYDIVLVKTCTQLLLYDMGIYFEIYTYVVYIALSLHVLGISLPN